MWKMTRKMLNAQPTWRVPGPAQRPMPPPVPSALPSSARRAAHVSTTSCRRTSSCGLTSPCSPRHQKRKGAPREAVWPKRVSCSDELFVMRLGTERRVEDGAAPTTP